MGDHTKKYGTVGDVTAIDAEFVARVASRAEEAERLRRLPRETVDDLIASGFIELLNQRGTGSQAELAIR